MQKLSIFLLSLPIMFSTGCTNYTNIPSENIEPLTIVEEVNVEPIVIKLETPSLRQIASDEYSNHMNKLETTEDKQQWFIEYKEIIDKYENIIDTPETIYDCYTEDELNKLFGVVAAEVGDEYGFNEKCNVASVIFNRIESDKFKDTLDEVLSKKQFSTISNGSYKRSKVTDKTILACEYAFMIEDTTDGALFFESGKSDIHSNYADYMFTDDAGHKFYK